MDQTQNTPTPKYWMSLDQWRQDPEFRAMAEKEFLSSPLQNDDGKEGWARREFLKLMGASLALTTFGCVRRPAQKIIPYVNKPVDITHGLPNYYASSYVDGLEGLGILVTTRDGRPIKVEGNPDFPGTGGGMSSRGHASIMKLYDPDRYTGPKRVLQNKERTNREIVGIKWDDLDKAIVEELNKGGVAILAATNLSPSTQLLVDDFSGTYGAKQYRYDDGGYESVFEGNKLSFGQGSLPRLHLEKARYVLAINNDFLGTWLNPTIYSRGFAQGRKANADMNKLVVAESIMSLTGSNADERYRIRPSQTLDLLLALAHELVVNKKLSRFAGDAKVTGTLAAFSKFEGAPVAEIAAELWKNRGQSLVLAGSTYGGTENAAQVQVAVNLLNAILENEGKTVEGASLASAKVTGDLGELLTALKGKQIKTLIIHGTNPLYTLPEASEFHKALANVAAVIYTGDRADETSRYADYNATDHHPLENWGDMLSLDGAYCVQQPTIQPLYDTRAYQDSLIAWTKASPKAPARVKAAANWYEYLHANYKDFARNTAFDDLLQVGVVADAGKGGARAFASSALGSVKPAAKLEGFELALYEKSAIGTGDLANVPWLQELPDPISKATWENYACLSPKDAEKLKIKDGHLVNVKVGDQTVKVPALVQAGQADGVIALAVGYGRQGGGQVCDGVGVNAFKLAAFKNGQRVTAGQAASVALAGGYSELAITQGHHTMMGRQIVVEETLKDHIKDPGGNVHRHHITTMWSEHKYPGHKWGMVVDLNTCTGCAACVIACQAENNIPSVGKKNVISGREMHWLRIDRYYTGTPEDPGVVHQPLPCMHCDNAPCETVCPVIATVHGEEGTNDMIYNRCVGTRYCSNNCPYKVRRFNWFNYQNEIPEPNKLALNPEVTVRFRGVMEKCTFCIHRIKQTKQQAKIHDRPLKVDEIKTACQQSCATGAITFGDLNNKEWTVAKEFTAPSTYALLEELNTKPAVRYKVKVRNSEDLKEAPAHKEEGHHA